MESLLKVEEILEIHSFILNISTDKFCSHLEKPYSRRSCPPCINIPKSESSKSDFKTSYTNPPALLHVSAAISLLGNQQKNIGKWITDEWSSVDLI